MGRSEILHEIDILEGTYDGLRKRLELLRRERHNLQGKAYHYSIRHIGRRLTDEELEKAISECKEQIDEYNERIRKIKTELRNIETKLYDLRYKSRMRYFEEGSFYVPNEESDQLVVMTYVRKRGF